MAMDLGLGEIDLGCDIDFSHGGDVHEMPEMDFGSSDCVAQNQSVAMGHCCSLDMDLGDDSVVMATPKKRRKTCVAQSAQKQRRARVQRSFLAAFFFLV